MATDAHEGRSREDAYLREAATREILEVISTSRDDDGPVFDAILRNAARLCKAPIASLMLVNAAGTHLVMAAMYGETLRTHLPGDSWPMDPLPGPVAGSIRTARIVHMHDLAMTDEYRSGHPTYVRLVEEDGLRTDLSVPLLRDGVGFGAITLSRRAVDPFDDADIALVETFAAQAVIAIENVRQFRELQERLEREAATRNILRIISESPDDEQPTFEAILDNATRLCGTPYASLVLGRKGDASQRMVAHRGAMDETLALFRNGKVPMNPEDSMGARAILEGRTIHVPDMADTDQYRSGHPRFRLVVDQQGLRTNLFVPLLGADGGIGCFILWKKEAAPFTADQIALMETFASHAVIAIENVRQFRELQVRLQREAATREILQVISQSRDDEKPVFEVILENACRLCDTPMADLILARSTDTHQTLAATRGTKDSAVALYLADGVPMDPAQSFGAQAIIERRVIHIANMAESDLYLRGSVPVRHFVDDENIRTILFVPLISNDEAIGVLVLFRYIVDPFDVDEIALVETFAAQAVIAIENVRQFRELQTRLEREKASAEILEVISKSRDDETPVFDMILRNVARLSGTNVATLSRLNPEGTHLELAANWGVPLKSFHVGLDRWSLDSPLQIVQSVREARVLHTADTADSDLYRSGNPDRVRLVEVEGVRSMLTVPMISASHTAIGCLALYRHGRQPFTPDDISLVETFAAQAVIAIENVRQFRALEALNAELGDRVQAQVGEIERMGRLKRFLPAAVADAVVTSGSEKLLSSHRALLGVLFCDIRGFTAFCETAEPEETIEVLQTYHEEMGKLIEAHGAGVDHRMGDGIMVLFNDPLPCDDPAGDAVRLALAMRERMAVRCQKWKRLGHRLGFGVGVSLGYATVGMVGSAGRFDYTASGTAINLASRLADEAQDGEILLSPRARTAVEGMFTVELKGEFTLKGIREPVEVFRVLGSATD